jgi:DNA-binding FrmR family transcriptional regulator
MRQCVDVPNVQARLKKIEGQIRALHNAMGEDVPCEDLLIQINAAKSALHKVGQVVLEGHLAHCVRDGIEHGDPTARWPTSPKRSNTSRESGRQATA